MQKLCMQLFCTSSLWLYFWGLKKLAKKFLVKCWWNWLKVESDQRNASPFICIRLHRNDRNFLQRSVRIRARIHHGFRIAGKEHGRITRDRSRDRRNVGRTFVLHLWPLFRPTRSRDGRTCRVFPTSHLFHSHLYQFAARLALSGNLINTCRWYPLAR